MSQHALCSPDRDAQIVSLQGQIDARDRVIEMLRSQLARLRRITFGTSSEKFAREIEQLELALEEYEVEAAVADVSAPDTAKSERPSPIRLLPPHLPREEIFHEPATGVCTCPSCGGALRRLSANADEILDVVPVSWRVVRNVRPKYSCRVTALRAALDDALRKLSPKSPMTRAIRYGTKRWTAFTSLREP